jgi:hypothetical protein
MTRDYNKQPRDDMRSSSRDQSPNRAGEERTPRPPRPRLNRETVDRAWESGAPTQHADYRTRSSNGQPSRNNWRNNRPSAHSSAQNGNRSYRPDEPNGNQQGNQRSFERTPNGNFGTRPRSYNASRERYDNQRPSGNSRPGSPGGFQKNGAYPGSRDNQQRQSQDQRPPFRENERNPGYQSRGSDEPGQRDFKRADRSPRSFERKPGNFERDSRPPRNFKPQTRDNEREGHSARSFERKPREFERGERPQRNYAGGNRPFNPARQRDTQNPRWQSRPAARQDSSSQERPDVKVRDGELFEGDYEQFDTQANQRNVRTERPAPGSKTGGRTRTEPEERHVTRLPDGRVLKGPRPAQRKNAQFWTGIASETEELIKQVESPATSETPGTAETVVAPETQPTKEEAAQGSVVDEKKATKAPRKPRSHAASAIASGKKEAKKEGVKKPRSSGPKPSQRGFKWPSPQ